MRRHIAVVSRARSSDDACLSRITGRKDKGQRGGIPTVFLVSQVEVRALCASCSFVGSSRSEPEARLVRVVAWNPAQQAQRMEQRQGVASCLLTLCQAQTLRRLIAWSPRVDHPHTGGKNMHESWRNTKEREGENASCLPDNSSQKRK